MIDRRMIIVLLLITVLLTYGCTQDTTNEAIKESNEEKTINTEESKDEKLERTDDNEITKKNDTLKPIQVDEHWGYENNNGDIVISPEFDEAKEFSEGLAAVKMRGRWVFINTKGKVVIDYRFDNVTSFDNGISKVKVYDHNGKINKDGEFIVDKNSDVIPKKIGNYFWGFVTEEDDKIAVYPKFKRIYEYSEGLALARIVDTNNKCGYINKSGEIVIGPKFDHGKPFKNGKAIVRKDKKWGLINNIGEVVVDFEFDEAEYFSDNLIKGTINRKMGMIKDSGEVVTDFKYDAIESYQENLYKVEIDGKWGLINDNGKMQIEPQFNTLKLFSEDFAVIEINDQWGYVNKQGAMSIEPEYDYAFPFDKNQAKVIKNNKVAVIDCQNNKIKEFKSIDNFDAYDELAIENIEEMKTVIDIFIPVVEPQLADQMINDLISFADQQKFQLSSYSRQYSQDHNNSMVLDRVIGNAISEAKKQYPELFNNGFGYFNKEKFLTLHYINSDQVSEKMENLFNSYLGVYFSEGDMSATVDYLHIHEKYGQYLTDEFSQYLEIKGENEDQPFYAETSPRLTPEEVGDRLISYENFMKTSENIKLKQEIKRLYMHGLRPLIYHNKGTIYLNEYYQATFDYRMALDHLWKQEKAEVTSIAARDMLDFICSKEDFVVRTYTESSDMRENYELIDTKVSKLLDEKYFNESTDE